MQFYNIIMQNAHSRSEFNAIICVNEVGLFKMWDIPKNPRLSSNDHPHGQISSV